MNKKELRKKYLDKRQGLTGKAELDKSILKQFFISFSISTNQVIHIYIAIEKFDEIDTDLFIDEFTKRGIRILVPRINGDLLTSIEMNSSLDWKINTWGIKEPTNGEEVSAELIDMVIVPLLGYDKTGQRVGYGKGFYDRFLEKCRPDCLKVGLSYFPPEEKIDDVGSQDLPLDFCVTPKKVYDF